MRLRKKQLFGFALIAFIFITTLSVLCIKLFISANVYAEEPVGNYFLPVSTWPSGGATSATHAKFTIISSGNANAYEDLIISSGENNYKVSELSAEYVKDEDGNKVVMLKIGSYGLYTINGKVAIFNVTQQEIGKPTDEEKMARLASNPYNELPAETNDKTKVRIRIIVTKDNSYKIRLGDTFYVHITDKLNQGLYVNESGSPIADYSHNIKDFPGQNNRFAVSSSETFNALEELDYRFNPIVYATTSGGNVTVTPQPVSPLDRKGGLKILSQVLRTGMKVVIGKDYLQATEKVDGLALCNISQITNDRTVKDVEFSFMETSTGKVEIKGSKTFEISGFSGKWNIAGKEIEVATFNSPQALFSFRDMQSEWIRGDENNANTPNENLTLEFENINVKLGNKMFLDVSDSINNQRKVIVTFKGNNIITKNHLTGGTFHSAAIINVNGGSKVPELEFDNSSSTTIVLDKLKGVESSVFTLTSAFADFKNITIKMPDNIFNSDIIGKLTIIKGDNIEYNRTSTGPGAYTQKVAVSVDNLKILNTEDNINSLKIKPTLFKLTKAKGKVSIKNVGSYGASELEVKQSFFRVKLDSVNNIAFDNVKNIYDVKAIFDPSRMIESEVSSGLILAKEFNFKDTIIKDELNAVYSISYYKPGETSGNIGNKNFAKIDLLGSSEVKSLKTLGAIRINLFNKFKQIQSTLSNLDDAPITAEDSALDCDVFVPLVINAEGTNVIKENVLKIFIKSNPAQENVVAWRYYKEDNTKEIKIFTPYEVNSAQDILALDTVSAYQRIEPVVFKKRSFKIELRDSAYAKLEFQYGSNVRDRLLNLGEDFIIKYDNVNDNNEAQSYLNKYLGGGTDVLVLMPKLIHQNLDINNAENGLNFINANRIYSLVFGYKYDGKIYYLENLLVDEAGKTRKTTYKVTPRKIYVHEINPIIQGYKPAEAIKIKNNQLKYSFALDTFALDAKKDGGLDLDKALALDGVYAGDYIFVLSENGNSLSQYIETPKPHYIQDNDAVKNLPAGRYRIDISILNKILTNYSFEFGQSTIELVVDKKKINISEADYKFYLVNEGAETEISVADFPQEYDASKHIVVKIIDEGVAYLCKIQLKQVGESDTAYIKQQLIHFAGTYKISVPDDNDRIEFIGKKEILKTIDPREIEIDKEALKLYEFEYNAKNIIDKFVVHNIDADKYVKIYVFAKQPGQTKTKFLADESKNVPAEITLKIDNSNYKIKNIESYEGIKQIKVKKAISGWSYSFSGNNYSSDEVKVQYQLLSRSSSFNVLDEIDSVTKTMTFKFVPIEGDDYNWRPMIKAYLSQSKYDAYNVVVDGKTKYYKQIPAGIYSGDDIDNGFVFVQVIDFNDKKQMEVYSNYDLKTHMGAKCEIYEGANKFAFYNSRGRKEALNGVFLRVPVNVAKREVNMFIPNVHQNIENDNPLKIAIKVEDRFTEKDGKGKITNLNEVTTDVLVAGGKYYKFNNATNDWELVSNYQSNGRYKLVIQEQESIVAKANENSLEFLVDYFYVKLSAKKGILATDKNIEKMNDAELKTFIASNVILTDDNGKQLDMKKLKISVDDLKKIIKLGNIKASGKSDKDMAVSGANYKVLVSFDMDKIFNHSNPVIKNKVRFVEDSLSLSRKAKEIKVKEDLLISGDIINAENIRSNATADYINKENKELYANLIRRAKKALKLSGASDLRFEAVYNITVDVNAFDDKVVDNIKITLPKGVNPNKIKFIYHYQENEDLSTNIVKMTKGKDFTIDGNVLTLKNVKHFSYFAFGSTSVNALAIVIPIIIIIILIIVIVLILKLKKKNKNKKDNKSKEIVDEVIEKEASDDEKDIENVEETEILEDNIYEEKEEDIQEETIQIEEVIANDEVVEEVIAEEEEVEEEVDMGSFIAHLDEDDDARDEDDDDDTDDDSDDEEAEVAVASNESDGTAKTRVRRKLQPVVKAYFHIIKNELMKYDGVQERYSVRFNSFRKGRPTIAKISVNYMTLKLYLNLDPKKIDERYKVVDVSNKKSFAKTPCLIKIKSKRSLRYAIELVHEMLSNCVPSGSWTDRDFTKPYNFPFDVYGDVKDSFRNKK